MSAFPTPFLTPEQYLDLDRRSDRPSEYHDGEIFPIETAGVRHGRIGINLTLALDKHLEGGPCQLIGATVRVRIPNTKRYTYPDQIVGCDRLEFEDKNRDTLLNPVLLFEVLSPSTEGYDRGEKFRLYRSIPSFKEYVLVSQDQVMIELFRREDEKNWHFQVITDLDAVLHLESVQVDIPLREIYAKVDFTTQD